MAVSLNQARERHDFDLWAYVFMPDHVHLLIRPRAPIYTVSGILQSIKGPFARKYLADCRERHPERLKRLEVTTQSGIRHRVWERGGGYDRNLVTSDVIRRAIEYIEFNPVRRGLVGDAEHWKWSSAGARAGVKDIPFSIDEVNWDLVPIG